MCEVSGGLVCEPCQRILPAGTACPKRVLLASSKSSLGVLCGLLFSAYNALGAGMEISVAGMSWALAESAACGAQQCCRIPPRAGQKQTSQQQ